jgi:hypothetical protein
MENSHRFHGFFRRGEWEAASPANFFVVEKKEMSAAGWRGRGGMGTVDRSWRLPVR